MNRQPKASHNPHKDKWIALWSRDLLASHFSDLTDSFWPIEGFSVGSTIISRQVLEWLTLSIAPIRWSSPVGTSLLPVRLVLSLITSCSAKTTPWLKLSLRASVRRVRLVVERGAMLLTLIVWPTRMLLLITLIATLRIGMASSRSLVPGRASSTGLHELEALGVLHRRPILFSKSTKSVNKLEAGAVKVRITYFNSQNLPWSILCALCSKEWHWQGRDWESDGFCSRH